MFSTHTYTSEGPNMKMIKGSRRLVVISLIVLAVLLISLSWALADTSPPLAEWISIIGTTGLDEESLFR